MSSQLECIFCVICRFVVVGAHSPTAKTELNLLVPKEMSDAAADNHDDHDEGTGGKLLELEYGR